VLLALALGTGGLPALAVQPEGVLLAQAAAGQKPVPAEVQGWFYGALAAYERANPTEALRLQQQVVAWVRANRGPVDADLASALNNLGLFLGAVGRRSEALAPTEEAVKIYRDLAKSNPAFLGDLAGALNNLGKALTEVGRRAEALAPSEEAVKIYRELAKSNPAFLGGLARALNNLGIRYSDLGRRAEALAPSEEAVKIYRELAKSNPAFLGDLAMALNNLGKALSEVSRRSEALAPTEEAVKIYRDLAKSNPAFLGDLAGVLNNLAYNYSDLGRRSEALAPTEEAVKIYRDLAKSNPAFLGDLAGVLNNLGIHDGHLGRRTEALAPREEAVKIYRGLAKSNPAFLGNLALALNNLGGAVSEVGRRAEALAPAEEAVKIFRELAKSNPAFLGDLAMALNNLGKALSEVGRSPEALSPTEEAVKIYRDLAKGNTAFLEELAQSTTNLAILQIQQGNPGAAIPLLRESMASEALFLQQQLPLMPEEQRQALVDTLGSRWLQPFSQAEQGPAGGELALYTRLNRYAPLQSIERRQAILSRSSGAPRQLVDRLSALTAELANANLDVNKRQQAQEESQRLQAELYRQLPELKPRLVEPSEVAQRLPADGVLVELQRYSPYDPSKPEGQRIGAERYLALVLQRSGTIQAVDLGLAQPLEQAIATALTATIGQTAAAAPAWAAVAEKVFGPLQAAIGGQRRWFIAPDGELHRVPFSALAVLAGGIRVLPEGVKLQSLGSGRDLLPLPAASSQARATTTALVLANPTTRGWPDLEGADAEGAAVATALRVPLQRGPAATVAQLQQAKSPRVIHVAGHGYFDPEAKGDPLLASGLVLAGADSSKLPSRAATATAASAATGQIQRQNQDDGYLSAKEAARLQLDGTQLVVLSACETGLGNQRTGEGVFGLQRALTVAGARGTLLSLWKVPDAASRTFMERFYALLSQGMAPSAAVRQVQAEFRSQPTIGGKAKLAGWSDPYYWAAWQYSGVPE
jgi:CHAT domain-containing protein/tetratricopeptide (TPR) repeat protein